MTDSSPAHKSTSIKQSKLNSLSDPLSLIKRNQKGGIAINQSELHQAFEFFDIENKGFITIQDLKKRLVIIIIHYILINYLESFIYSYISFISFHCFIFYILILFIFIFFILFYLSRVYFIKIYPYVNINF